MGMPLIARLTRKQSVNQMKYNTPFFVSKQVQSSSLSVVGMWNQKSPLVSSLKDVIFTNRYEIRRKEADEECINILCLTRDFQKLPTQTID